LPNLAAFKASSCEGYEVSEIFPAVGAKLGAEHTLQSPGASYSLWHQFLYCITTF